VPKARALNVPVSRNTDCRADALDCAESTVAPAMLCWGPAAVRLDCVASAEVQTSLNPQNTFTSAPWPIAKRLLRVTSALAIRLNSRSRKSITAICSSIRKPVPIPQPGKMMPWWKSSTARSSCRCKGRSVKNKSARSPGVYRVKPRNSLVVSMHKLGEDACGSRVSHSAFIHDISQLSRISNRLGAKLPLAKRSSNKART